MGFALVPGEHMNCMPVQATASHHAEPDRATGRLDGIARSSPAPAGTPAAQRAACPLRPVPLSPGHSPARRSSARAAIGRLVADDVAGYIRYLTQHAA
jgi:hypothetical protein